MDYSKELSQYMFGSNLWAVFELLEDRIKAAPAAAGFHHNFEGGLARHIVEMIQFGMPIVKTLWGPEGLVIDAREFIDVCFLHDLAKIEFYKRESDNVYSYVKHPYVLQEMVVQNMCATAGVSLSDNQLNALWLAEGSYSPVFGKIEATPLATLLHMADLYSSQLLCPKLVIDTPCPLCREGTLTKKTNGSSGSIFYACTKYPACKYTQAETPEMKMVENVRADEKK